jgi:cytochrome c-type biogenesis protein
MQRERRVHARLRAGLVGAPLIGVTFGLGWAPCLTPTLSVVWGMAQQQATAFRGAILSTAYCIGLGVPFIAVALGLSHASGVLGFMRRYIRAISIFGGSLLIVFGALLVTGDWDHIMYAFNSWVAGFNAGPGSNL